MRLKQTGTCLLLLCQYLIQCAQDRARHTCPLAGQGPGSGCAGRGQVPALSQEARSGSGGQPRPSPPPFPLLENAGANSAADYERRVPGGAAALTHCRKFTAADTDASSLPAPPLPSQLRAPPFCSAAVSETPADASCEWSQHHLPSVSSLFH